jgi:hypothetical protein
MKKLYLSGIVALAAFVTAGGMLAKWFADRGRLEQRHYDREETELIVSNLTGARIQLYQAGKNLSDTTRIAEFNGKRICCRAAIIFCKSLRAQNFSLPLDFRLSLRP